MAAAHKCGSAARQLARLVAGQALSSVWVGAFHVLGKAEIQPGRGDELYTSCDLVWSEAFVLDAARQIYPLVCFVVLGCGMIWDVASVRWTKRQSLS